MYNKPGVEAHQWLSLRDGHWVSVYRARQIDQYWVGEKYSTRTHFTLIQIQNKRTRYIIFYDSESYCYENLNRLLLNKKLNFTLLVSR